MDTESDAWMDAVRMAAADATSLEATPGMWTAITARLDHDDVMVLPLAPGGRGRRMRAAAVAAGLVLCAGVAAALVPQIGVRSWIERQLGLGADVVPVEPADASSVTQLALAPVNGVLHVELIGPAAPLRLRVRLSEAAELDVRATGTASAAQFLAGNGRLEIAGATGGEIVLSLPRAARVITIDVDGARALELRDARLTVFAADADTVGAEIILPLP